MGIDVPNNEEDATSHDQRSLIASRPKNCRNVRNRHRGVAVMPVVIAAMVVIVGGPKMSTSTKGSYVGGSPAQLNGSNFDSNSGN